MALTYTFFTTWHLPASPEEVWAVLSDETLLPQWWPSAFLWVGRRAQGEERGVGRTADVLARGFLPYTLRWRIRVTDILPEPEGFVVQVHGDLNGTGTWTAQARGEGSAVSLLWSVQVGHPLLRRWERLLWPLFHANHHWAMHQGERSLRLELCRRRGEAHGERPPCPVTMNVLWRRLTNAKMPP